ncbi:glycosyltransferase family 2 protein [Halalkalicoccus subterraneus]|uniref:glycosyltransferase family 2 protein n=1 Tax=Halalkalicoccus subterraneus TaxID=2675002 RepID=UPI0013CE8F4E|nr:glycosyltransferase family 2 protein [Halalkalicoccus subterraneus]
MEWEDTYVLVGIPAYNAADSIGRVVKKVKAFADHVLVVDDGSADATAKQAREAGAEVVSHKRNRGYGGALQTIFRQANDHGTDLLVTLDADEQHDPRTIPRLIEATTTSTADIVIGSRYTDDAATDLPFVRSIGLGIVNLLTNWSMGRLSPHNWILDTQSGFRAYSSEAIESLAFTDRIGDGMWASTNILYHAQQEGFDFTEVGTTIRYDVEQGSTEGALSHGFGLVKNISRFAQRTHPLLLLGVPGVLCAIIGIFVAILSLQFVLLSQFSLALVAYVVSSAGLLLFGFSLMFLGVLLHAFNIHPFFDE